LIKVRSTQLGKPTIDLGRSTQSTVAYTVACAPYTSWRTSSNNPAIHTVITIIVHNFVDVFQYASVTKYSMPYI